MAYEVESISPTTTPIDATAPNSPTMREERVVSPYRMRTLATELAAKLGQPDNTEPSLSAEAAEPAPTPKATEETVALSPQMAALARKEQVIRRQERELKAEKDALAAERAEIEEVRQIKARIAAKDFSDIEKLVPYDGYTNYLLEKGATTTPEQQALKKLEAELEGVKKTQEDGERKAFEAAVAERRAAVNALVESDAEFSSIKERGVQEGVVQYILDTWEEDGIDLPVEQALKEVENELLEREKARVPLSKLKLVPAEEEKKVLPSLKQGVKTLTNEMTIQGEVARPKKSFQGMSEEERYAEARRRAEDKLKQGIR